MKKIVCLIMIGILFVVGCEKVETKYKEGIYQANVIDNYGGQENTVTAKITIDQTGKITNVYLDSTYTKDGVETTKKTLGDDYGMKTTSANKGKIPGGAEWYEQVEAFEKYVVDNQGLDNITLDDGVTDTVSGCTIKVDTLYKATEEALAKAKE